MLKITKLQLQQIIREEIIDFQGKYNDDFKFKVGMIVKDINPDCPHHGSEGIVTKVTPDEVTYTVRNNGKNYKIGNILTKTKDQLTPLKLDESKLNEFSAIKWSSPEAKTQVNNDLRSMSKLLGKASQNVIKIMLSGVKDNKYDAMDLSRGIQTGDIKVTHMGERDFLESLWSKIREKFRKYTKSGKLR